MLIHVSHKKAIESTLTGWNLTEIDFSPLWDQGVDVLWTIWKLFPMTTTFGLSSARDGGPLSDLYSTSNLIFPLYDKVYQNKIAQPFTFRNLHFYSYFSFNLKFIVHCNKGILDKFVYPISKIAIRETPVDRFRC